MKKYLIIIAIIQIVLSIFIMINSQSLLQTELETIKETYSKLPVDFQERAISLTENAGIYFYIFFAVISIILNLKIITIAKNNNILKKKGVLIACFVATYFLSMNFITSILSIVSFFVVILLKRKNPEDFPDKEKNKIPELKCPNRTKKDIILSIILLVIYFSQLWWSKFIPDSYSVALTISIIFDILLFILAVIFFFETLKRDFGAVKGNIKSYIRYILPRYGVMYIVYIIVGWISIIITNQATTVNQEAVEALPKFYIIPAAIIWAPIVEEILFRGTLRKLIKNDIFYIIISALVFGLLHTISEVTILSMIINALPYAILGGFFAYLYTKTNNLSNCIGCHAFHNTIAVLLTLLI